jgi:hypothetical protein
LQEEEEVNELEFDEGAYVSGSVPSAISVIDDVVVGGRVAIDRCPMSNKIDATKTNNEPHTAQAERTRPSDISHSAPPTPVCSFVCLRSILDNFFKKSLPLMALAESGPSILGCSVLKTSAANE